MGATATLAEFVAETAGTPMPDDAQAAALRQIVDCTGVALAATAERPGRIVAELTAELGGAPRCRLLGTGIRTSAIQAAWANGTLSHLLDYDDHGFSHPTACLLPVAYALAEQLRADGQRFMTAMVVGYEVFERLSVSARPYERAMRARGYHMTSLYGGPAAAAAAGVLLGLDAGQVAVALGLAAAGTSGLMQQFGTWGKGAQAGTAARAGMTAALMAAKGYRADDEVIEGRYGFFNAIHGEGRYDLGRLADGLGKQWAICDPGLSIKRFPSCGATIRPIEGALALLREHRVAYDEIERVEVEVHPTILHALRHRRPDEGFRGKFSIDYCVGAAILDGRVDLDSFTDTACARRRFREAMAKVDVVVHDDWPMDYRQRNPVTFVLRDGRRLTAEVANPRGSRRNPMSDAEVWDKYRGSASRVLRPEQVERSLDALQAVGDAPDLAAVLDVLVTQAEAA